MTEEPERAASHAHSPLQFAYLQMTASVFTADRHSVLTLRTASEPLR